MDLFGTAGIRGDVDTHVTPELALAVGGAVADAITADAVTSDGTLDPEIVVARDGRVTGPALANAIAAGAAAGGARVRRAGMLPTPALAFASQGRYGIIVTASHNPPHDNGIKLFRDGVEFDRDAEHAVETRVSDGIDTANWESWTDPASIAVIEDYREAVTAYARQFGAPLAGLRIAVDCGNGMASLATPAVLSELGATVVTLNGNVDGHFSGRGSKPTPETLADLRRFIADANDGIEAPGQPDADGGFAFGIGHDGDADRIVIVDAEGDIVHEDTVLAILAERYTRTSEAADPVVVTTPNASGRIDERVQEAGGRVDRVRLGALHEGIAAVRDAAAENGAADAADTEVVFAAEPWKHTHTRFGGWIDGVCSAAVFARIVAADGLDALRAPVTERPYRKVSVACPDDRKDPAMDHLGTALPEAFPAADVSTDHGVRLEFPDASWILVRPSGTEPYIRLYAESDDVDDLVATARSVIQRAVEAVDDTQ